MTETPDFGHFNVDWRLYPPVEDVLALPLLPTPEWVEGHFKRNANPCAEFANYSAALKRDAARYEDIRKRGEDALSRYDVEIYASGNADAAINTALALKFNHIMYQKMHLQHIREHWPFAVLSADPSLETVAAEEQIESDDDGEICEGCDYHPDECQCLSDEPESDDEQPSLFTPEPMQKGQQLSLF